MGDFLHRTHAAIDQPFINVKKVLFNYLKTARSKKTVFPAWNFLVVYCFKLEKSNKIFITAFCTELLLP